MPPLKRNPQGRDRRQGSLTLLWVILVLLLIGGIVLVATMMSNARKARERAQHLRQQIEVATTLVDKINNVTDAIIGMRSKSDAVGNRAGARVSSVLEITGEPEEVSAEYAARPGLKSPPERLRHKEMEIQQKLRHVDMAIDEAKVAQTAVERELSRLKREPTISRAASTVADFKSRLLQLDERRERTAKTIELAEIIAKEIDAVAAEIIETQRRNEEAAAREHEEREAQEDTTVEARYQTQMLELIKAFRFEQAHQLLTAPGVTYHSDEARARHQLMVDQSEALVAMKSALIKAMIAAPFSWGWRQDGSPRDIVGATASHVLVGERDIPWEAVSLRQMSSILNAYIYGRKVKPVVRCNHSIAAAIYFAAQGRADIAEAILDAALDLRPEMTRDADRLARSFMARVQQSAPAPTVGIHL